MRLKSLTIENFKGISDPVTIELKPITLLFGPNSVGKSTIVQALHYVREILDRGNVDMDRILGADESFNLGGFVNFVHNHDRSKSIHLRVEFDLDDDELEPITFFRSDKPIYSYMLQGSRLSLQEDGTDLNYHAHMKSAWIGVSVSWSYVLENAYLSSYEVGINGEELAKITCANDGKRISLSYLNFDHPSFTGTGNPIYGFQEPEYERSIFEEYLRDLVLPDYWDDNGSINLLLENQKSVLPDWGKHLLIAPVCLVDIFSENSDDYNIQEAIHFLSQAIVSPGSVLLEKLNSFFYIGPIRKVPTRNYNPVRSEDLSRWSSGLAAWDRLHLGAPGFVDNVSDWLSGSERLNAGYTIKLRRYKEVDIDSPLYIAMINDRYLDEEIGLATELEKISERRELVLIDEERQVQVFPQDIGVGISQILPVVVAALDNNVKVLMVEQPELHIHPGLQCRIGDLLINQIQDDDKMFIIETHSEHLLLRLLRRIREKSDGDLPPGIAGLATDQLSVNYVDLIESSGNAKAMRISALKVSTDGDSLGQWPEGFFEERAGELF